MVFKPTKKKKTKKKEEVEEEVEDEEEEDEDEDDDESSEEEEVEAKPKATKKVKSELMILTELPTQQIKFQENEAGQQVEFMTPAEALREIVITLRKLTEAD